MGVVSSVFGLFLPKPKMQYAPSRFARIQFQRPIPRRLNPQKDWARRTGQSFRPMSIRIQPSQVPINRVPLQARRSFAPTPMVQPQKRPGLFGGILSNFSTSTTFEVQRNQNIRKQQNSVQGFFARQRKNAFMSSMISGLRR